VGEPITIVDGVMTKTLGSAQGVTEFTVSLGGILAYAAGGNHCNREPVGDRMRLLPGEGIINLRGFMTALQQIGYEGGLAPEPLGRLPNELSDEASARLAYDTTLRVMQAAGVPQA
jgi:sugar phosphate isomerase/epimerase